MINDYSQYCININLINIIQMYLYNSIFMAYLKKNKFDLMFNDYYLVNINFLSEYKKYYHYDQIKRELNNIRDKGKLIYNIYIDILNNNNKININKLFYLFVKALNPDINIKFNTIKNEILNKNNINPEITEIDYYDCISKEKKQLRIENNFQLVNKNIISFFIDENKLPKNEITYNIINDYILINYPKGKNNNHQYITLLGSINDEANITIKYILIYYSDKDRFDHITLLKNYLYNYLKGISLINSNSTQIINDKYEIIGILIKYIYDNKNNLMDEINIMNNNKKEYKELELKYNEEKKINNNLNNELERIKDSLNKEKNIINTIINNNSNKESLLNEEISKNNILKNKNDELSKELQDIKSDNNDLNDKINQLNSDLENEKKNCSIIKNSNNELSKELNDIKLKNNDSKNQINKLKNDLENEKEINNKLNNEILELKNDLNNERNTKNELNEIIINKENENKSKLNELTKKVEFYESVSKNDENDIKNKVIMLYEELESKKNEIKEIQSRYPVTLTKDEKLICIILKSKDQKVLYPIICKSSDKFTKIEEILCDKFPEYSESENIFTVNEQKINRVKNLEFNKIKYGDVITFYQENKNL